MSQKSCPIITLNQALKKKSHFSTAKAKKRKKDTDVLDLPCLWQWEMPLSCFHLRQPLHKAKQRKAGRHRQQASTVLS